MADPTGEGVTAPARAWGVRDPDSGRGSGGDPGLGGRGLAGSALPGHGESCLRPRMGWGGWAEPSGARAGRARSPPRHRQSPAAELRSPRSCGCQVSTRGPCRGRIGVPWFGAEASEIPRPAPGWRHHALSKPELLPGRAQVDPRLSSCTLASLGVGDNVDWRHPLFTARPRSPPGQLGFRRS